MKLSLSLLGSAAAVALLLGGCSKNAASLGASNASLFASAPAPVKASWDKATAAIATNGYATAIIALKALQEQPGLSAEQLKAVNDTVNAVSDQMYAAANKGDANAKQAIQSLRQVLGR